MRSFGIVSPQFWTGQTGKEIQACGCEPIVLAVYLMTSPHSHMCGLYYVPKEYIVLDTGRPLRAIEKAFLQLRTLPSGAFSFYDDKSRYVWVPEMLKWQVGELKPKDGRIQGIINWYKALPSIPFVHAFFDRYSREIPGLPKRGIPALSWGPEGGVEGAPMAPKSCPDPDPAPLPDPDPVLDLEGGSGETKPDRPRDLASDYFASKCRECTTVPYSPEGSDFVMLAKLRKSFNIPARQLPPGWEHACENYFASPLGQYSLADLANPKRYAVFVNSPVDDFNKPIHHANRSNGNAHKTKTDRTIEAAQRLSNRLDRSDGGGDERGTQRSNTTRVLPEAEDFQA